MNCHAKPAKRGCKRGVSGEPEWRPRFLGKNKKSWPKMITQRQHDLRRATWCETPLTPWVPEVVTLLLQMSKPT